MTTLSTNRIFDLKRFLYLVRFELYTSYRALIIILAASIGCAALVNLTTIPAAGHWPIHETMYNSIVLMIGGLVFSSLSFTGSHKKGNDLRYITLPASNLEKTASKFLTTAVLYIVTSIVVYFIVTTLMAGFTLLVFGRTHGLFNPFGSTTLLMLAIYLVIQSIFVFGSVFFRKMALAKTILSLMALGLAISIFAGLVFFLVNIDVVVSGGYWANRGDMFWGPSPGFLLDLLRTVPGLIFWLLLAPFFWLLTYFRLKEKEV